jgi:hypothetical protein
MTIEELLALHEKAKGKDDAAEAWDDLHNGVFSTDEMYALVMAVVAAADKCEANAFEKPFHEPVKRAVRALRKKLKPL